MTPTLFGRWQTRLFLLATIGVIVSFPFYLGFWGGYPGNLIHFLILFYVGLFGVFWDILYDYLQRFLWDHDWPGILQLITGITEGIFLALILSFFGLPGIDYYYFDLNVFIAQYTLVWVSIYISSWVIMRLLFTSWRFRGGEWLGKWPYKNG
jgi:hypothetical protein